MSRSTSPCNHAAAGHRPALRKRVGTLPRGTDFRSRKDADRGRVSGARLCEPQRVALQSRCCGSQTRAPGRGGGPPAPDGGVPAGRRAWPRPAFRKSQSAPKPARRTRRGRRGKLFNGALTVGKNAVSIERAGRAFPHPVPRRPAPACRARRSSRRGIGSPTPVWARLLLEERGELIEKPILFGKGEVEAGGRLEFRL